MANKPGDPYEIVLGSETSTVLHKMVEILIQSLSDTVDSMTADGTLKRTTGSIIKMFLGLVEKMFSRSKLKLTEKNVEKMVELMQEAGL